MVHKQNSGRKIIHIDMDAFFACIEQRDNPDYLGKPLVVGGNPDGRGVVAAASYEIRPFGVRSAMSCYEAKKRCPHAIFVRPRFDVYRQVSRKIQEIMLTITPLVEPLSLDEAYLDVTGQSHFQGSATLMANHLRQKIWESTHLTASAGVSFNKMLAKIASDVNKPNGIFVITPNMADDFIDRLAIEKFFGIGKASQKKLHNLNIYYGHQFRQLPLEKLIELFGNKRGIFYHQIAQGIDIREVLPNRTRKSIGTETTFTHDLTDKTQIFYHIGLENQKAFDELNRRGLCAYCVTLKIKYGNFHQITRSHTQKQSFTSAKAALFWLEKLFLDTPEELPIRLVGVTFSHLAEKHHEKIQPDLFADII